MGTARNRDRETLGRSRGGLTTKIHVAADSNCRVLARVTSAGQRHDSLAFEPVMARISVAGRSTGRTRPRTRPGRVLADKAYSSKAIRGHLRRRNIKATIPEPADQIKHRRGRGRRGGRPPAFDREQYKRRNAVERAFAKLRQHRAVATRYDKRDFVYRGTVDVASIRICCAMRRSVISLAQRGEIGGISLDLMANPASKGNIGDDSMPEN